MTTLSDAMDAPEIAMEERVKVDDRVASAMLHASTSSNPTTSDTESGGIIQEVAGAPEVSLPHSLNSQFSCPYRIRERFG